MWISNFAIARPVITTVTMLALVVFGLLALALLDTDEFPEVDPPVISVTIPYPGASPEVVERELIVPLEEAFSSISGVDEQQSTAQDGFATLTVIFVYEKDLQLASQDIRDKISSVRRELPPEIEEPVLTRFDPNDLPIVSLVLASDSIDAAELTRLADPGIVGELRGIPGVAEVRLLGSMEPEITVDLLPSALEARGLSLGEVVAALQAQNLAAPVGRITAGSSERTLRLEGRVARPQDFEALAVRTKDGAVVRLGDIAEIALGHEEPRSLAFFNGRQAIGIDLVKQTGESTTRVSKEIAARIATLREQLPPGVELRTVRDAGPRVAASVTDVQRSLIAGAILTVLVVFLFLNSWRSTIITGLALPVSVLASFIAVLAFGFTLNTMSLLGLSLAIGILIDDAIVVRENIVRHMELGKDHVRAAREGTAEIGLAVAATTFSIVVVFIPVAFMGGIAEQWFAPFALTIACSVLVSLLVSFSLDPMLSANWPDPEVEHAKKSWLTRKLAFVNHLLESQTGRYQRLVDWALHHRLVVVLIALGSFLVALALPAIGLIGGEFLPAQDRSELTLQLELPPGSSLSYSREKALAVARLSREMEEVAYTYTTVGTATESIDEALVYVRLVPRHERERGQAAIADELRRKAERFVGTDVSISDFMFGGRKSIQLELRGPNIEELSGLAEEIAAVVKEVPGAVDVGLSTRGRKPDLEVSIDRELAARLGIDMAQLGQALRIAFAGVEAGTFIDEDGETRDVRVRLAPTARIEPADVLSLPIVVQDAKGQTITVPLAQIATVRRSTGPAQIDHLDRDRVITIGANTRGASLTEVVGAIEARLTAIALPPGYLITQGGETEDQQEVFGRIFVALGVAVLLMYLILVIQFDSFLDPIAILASLPLSLIGVMLALLVTGTTLNLMSLIGVILLLGIVAKNAILLIDFAKWTEASGVPRREALVRAGGVRLRPILMTSFAIIAGMLPVAIGGGEGGDFRAPLGRAVIGGVITSTLLTLLVIPTFYDLLMGLRDRVRARLRRRTRRPHGLVRPGEQGAE